MSFNYMDILDAEYDANEDTNVFTEGELILTEKIDKETGKKTIMSGGYKVDSHFLNNGIPLMTTSAKDVSPSEHLFGGGNEMKYDTLAVPAGIYFINQKIPKYTENNSFDRFENRKVIDEDIFDKLFANAENSKRTKQKKLTRNNHKGSIGKRKSRKTKK